MDYGIPLKFARPRPYQIASFLETRDVPVLSLKLKGLHASNAAIGLLVGSIPGAMNMIITPIVSYRSDRHRGRLGRRDRGVAVPPGRGGAMWRPPHRPQPSAGGMRQDDSWKLDRKTPLGVTIQGRAIQLHAQTRSLRHSHGAIRYRHSVHD